MILQSLQQLYGRLADDSAYAIAPPGFSPQKVSFKIVLREDGSLFEIEDARIQSEGGKLRPSIHLVFGDGQRSGSLPTPFITWDNALYLLGFPPKKAVQDRGENDAWNWARERFEASKKAHLEFAENCGSDMSLAVAKFFSNWSPDRCSEYPMLDEIAGNYGVFSIVGQKQCFHNDAKALILLQTSKQSSNHTDTGQCLITGNIEPIARLHQKIKGISPPKGKQQKDGPLVSIDKGSTSFNSYTKVQARNSPVSESAAFEYATALNSLLTGPKSNKHRLRIGDTTCVFWTEKRTVLEDCFAELFGSGSQGTEEVQDEERREDLERLLNSVRQGGKFLESDDFNTGTPFYLLGLAPNAARLSVRFFHRSTVGELLENLHDHHNCLQIVREFPEARGNRKPDPEFPAIWQLLLQSARVSDEIPPLLGGALARAIIDGTHYPEGLFSAVIRRIRSVENDKNGNPVKRVTYLRAALLKAILKRNYEITMSITLDKNHPSPAYHLGRLFAVFEQSQRQAHEFKLERTIRETFYSAASANPLSVFSRLQRLHMHHLRKLSVGSQKYFEDWISEINQKFKSVEGAPATYPLTLNLKEQGLFSIGYYHQMHAMKNKENS